MARRGIGFIIVGFLSIGTVLVSTAVRAQSAVVAATPLNSSGTWDKSISPRAVDHPALDIAASFSPPVFDASTIDSAETSEVPPESSFTEQAQGTTMQGGNQESALNRVTDPTSPSTTIRFRELWNWPENNSGPDNQEFQFRPTIPFKAWGQQNLLRVTIPYDISGADGAGLDNVTILDLAVHKSQWGRWGVGPVGRFTPANGSDSDTFQIGPAAGAVAEDEHWTIGF